MSFLIGQKLNNNDIVDSVESPADRLLGASIDEVLGSMGLTEWDAVIFTDGSGTGWDMGGGFAAVVSTRSGTRTLCYGGLSHSTVSVSELSAILYSLLWYESNIPVTVGRKPVVHIFSDSQTTVVGVGKGTAQAKASSTIPLWAAIRTIGLRLNLNYHWLPRSTTALNKICDWVAGTARKQIEAIPVKEMLPENLLYSCNPIHKVSA